MIKTTAKTKQCPNCGKTFECLHNEHCWCLKYKLSQESLDLIANRFDDCLCEDCLREYAEQHPAE